MSDSLFNEEKSKEMGILQGRHETIRKMERLERERKARAAVEAAAQERRARMQYYGIIFFLAAMLVAAFWSGRFAIPLRVAKGVVFVTVVLLFEFLLVLLDPYIQKYAGGNPALILAFNGTLALGMLPVFNFLVNKLTVRITRMQVARGIVARARKKKGIRE